MIVLAEPDEGLSIQLSAAPSTAFTFYVTFNQVLREQRTTYQIEPLTWAGTVADTGETTMVTGPSGQEVRREINTIVISNPGADNLTITIRAGTAALNYPILIVDTRLGGNTTLAGIQYTSGMGWQGIGAT